MCGARSTRPTESTDDMGVPGWQQLTRGNGDNIDPGCARRAGLARSVTDGQRVAPEDSACALRKRMRPRTVDTHGTRVLDLTAAADGWSRGVLGEMASSGDTWVTGAARQGLGTGPGAGSECARRWSSSEHGARLATTMPREEGGGVGGLAAAGHQHNTGVMGRPGWIVRRPVEEPAGGGQGCEGPDTTECG